MKLRNKKTGEIGEPRVAYQEIYIDTTEYKTYCYKSIAGLNEEWEDYEPAEPLIKDKKIRKAVRAWAEVDEIEAVEIVSKYQLISLDEQCSIEFFKEIYPGYVHNEEHTITELCGEEKE